MIHCIDENIGFFDTSSKLTTIWKWSTRRVSSASWYRFSPHLFVHPWPVNHSLPTTCRKNSPKKKELVDNFSRTTPLSKTKGPKWLTLDPPKKLMILLMEEIPNNHLGCIKPSKSWEKLRTNWWTPDFWTINSRTYINLRSQLQFQGPRVTFRRHQPSPHSPIPLGLCLSLAASRHHYLLPLDVPSCDQYDCPPPRCTWQRWLMTHPDLRLQNTLEIPFTFFGCNMCFISMGAIFFFFWGVVGKNNVKKWCWI